MKIAPLIFFLLLPFCTISNAQQTYLKQKEGLYQSRVNNGEASSDGMEADTFVGCIDYNVIYSGVPVEDKEMNKKAEFLVQYNTENLGVKRTQCFNEHGDWVTIYHGAKHIDRIWYFSESNEEYTLFANGVLKFAVNDETTPDGVEAVGIPVLRKTYKKKKILDLEVHQMVLENGGENHREYWVSDTLLLNPRSYEKNILGHTNEIMKALKGVPLYKKKTIADLFVTIEEATEIRQEHPQMSLFVLPQVNLYDW